MPSSDDYGQVAAVSPRDVRVADFGVVNEPGDRGMTITRWSAAVSGLPGAGAPGWEIRGLAAGRASGVWALIAGGDKPHPTTWIMRWERPLVR